MLFSLNSPIGSTISFERNTENEAGKALSAIVLKDSDGDSLKDWEETLWKTDPQNPDSDGDGTYDGEEVRLGRDPMKPSPGDDLKKTDIKKEGPANSFTDSLLKDTLASYNLVRQPGVSNTELSKKINSDLEQKIRAKIYNPDTRIYEIKDIIITENNNENSIREYKKQLREMGKKYEDTYENEITVVNNTLITENSQELEKLNAAISTYKNMIKDLLTITTPSNLAQTHLNIINTYSALIDSVEKMKEILKDPIIGIAGILQYQRDSKNLIIIAAELGFQTLPKVSN